MVGDHDTTPFLLLLSSTVAYSVQCTLVVLAPAASAAGATAVFTMMILFKNNSNNSVFIKKKTRRKGEAPTRVLTSLKARYRNVIFHIGLVWIRKI